MILPRGHVLVHQSRDDLPVENMRGECRRSGQLLAYKSLIGALEPTTDWNPKAYFFSVKYRVRQDSFHRHSENQLAPLTTKKEFIRKTRNQSGQLGVHERHAPLNRPCHHHAVAPFEEIVRQPRRLIEEHRLATIRSQVHRKWKSVRWFARQRLPEHQVAISCRHPSKPKAHPICEIPFAGSGEKDLCPAHSVWK